MNIFEKFKDYDLKHLTHITDISRYNYNYYSTPERELLYCWSNDVDDSSEWYLITGETSRLLGMSFFDTFGKGREVIKTDECYRK